MIGTKGGISYDKAMDMNLVEISMVVDVLGKIYNEIKKEIAK